MVTELLLLPAPVGTIYWYSDAGLTTQVGTGVLHTPAETAVGSYDRWVVDKSLTGLLCQSPATKVTLTINSIPNQPTITRNNPNFCFDGISSIILTADPHAPPPITSYQWYRNTVAVGGATGSTITRSTVAQSGDYTVRTYGIAPTNCPSPLSPITTVLIDSPPSASVGPAQNICGTLATALLFQAMCLLVELQGIGQSALYGERILMTCLMEQQLMQALLRGQEVIREVWTGLEVRSERFEAKEIDGECVWSSQVVNITGHTNVGIAVTLIGGATNDPGSDYIRAYYRLNGGPETALTNGLQERSIWDRHCNCN